MTIQDEKIEFDEERIHEEKTNLKLKIKTSENQKISSEEASPRDKEKNWIIQ